VNAMTDMDTRLDTRPVHVEVANGKVVSFKCDDEEITTFLDTCFSRHCAVNVGELGFGTNFGARRPIPMNSHINERSPGIHLGFGQHNQDNGSVPYQCDLHLDLIAKGGIVKLDDLEIDIDLSEFTTTEEGHPMDFRDEDVFSPDLDDIEVEDCCGVFEGGELRIVDLH